MAGVKKGQGSKLCLRFKKNTLDEINGRSDIAMKMISKSQDIAIAIIFLKKRTERKRNN